MADRRDPKPSGLLSLARDLARAAVTRAIERLTGQPLSERARTMIGARPTPALEPSEPPPSAARAPAASVTPPPVSVSSPARAPAFTTDKIPPSVAVPAQVVTRAPATDPAPSPPSEPMGLLDLEEVPETYGTDEVGLLVRDAHWMVAYWEVTAAAWDRARRELGGDGVLTLRLYDERQGRLGPVHDERLPWDHGRRGLRPPRVGAPLTAAVGLLASDGRFATMAFAPRVHVPPTEPSPGPLTWMDVEPPPPAGVRPAPPRVRAVGDAEHVAAEVGAEVGARRVAWLAQQGKIGFEPRPGSGVGGSSPAPGSSPSGSSPGKKA